MLYPLTFDPIFKERVWGGRKLEQLYHKPLPKGIPIGESWEISDRPGDVSVIANGPLAGKDLHWLLEHHAEELLGKVKALDGRFPLLVKILDAREKLSLQVHPPANKAAELGGDPKTEMWYIADAAPGAELCVGLKRDGTREEFEEKLRAGMVAECVHRIKVQAGDAMFLPSGRLHAIGAGLVIFEIQQNSDTTYRIFDWNRAGLEGKPRDLHVEQSLASINFKDFEPSLIPHDFRATGPAKVRPLVNSSIFKVDAYVIKSSASISLEPNKMQIIAVLTGRLHMGAGKNRLELSAGQFCLIPASVSGIELNTDGGATFLRVESGDN